MDHILTAAGSTVPITWQCAQLLRWTSLSNYGQRYLASAYPSSASLNGGLALDAGVVLALAQPQASTASPRSADVEFADLRLGLVATASKLRATEPVVLARLPVLAGPVTRVPSPVDRIKVPAVTAGTPPAQIPDALVLAQGLGPQILSSLQVDPQTPASPELFPLLRRSQLAVWLKSIQVLQAAQVSDNALSPPFRPAFLDPNSTDDDPTLTFKLPAMLADLGPLLSDNRSGARPYDASMLVTPYPLDGSVPVMRGARVLDYPYVVRSLDDASDPGLLQVHLLVDLVVFGRRDLSVVESAQLDINLNASALVPALADDPLLDLVSQWGSGQLIALDRREAAVVVARPSAAVMSSVPSLLLAPIPRRFDVAAHDVSDRPIWLPTNPDPIDPRMLRPRDAAGGLLAATRVAEADLGCLVFDAAPAGDPQSIRALSAATRFRLTHLSRPPRANEAGPTANHNGRLRPPAVRRPADPGAAEGGVLALSKWDVVPFAAYGPPASLAAGPPPAPPLIPAPGERAALRRPAWFQANEIGPNDDPADNLVSLIPPLCDIVASASRPGERTRTAWSLQRQRQRNGQITEFSAGPAAVVGLRRPRAAQGAIRAFKSRAS